MKIYRVLLAGILLLSQIAWAGELYSPIDAFNEQHSNQFAPDYVNNQQNAHESLVSHDQDVESALVMQAVTQNSTQDSADAEESQEDIELQGPSGVAEEPTEEPAAYEGLLLEAPMYTMAATISAPIYVTVETGDVVRFQDGQVTSIEKADGRIFQNLILDASNNLVSGEIVYLDGTIQTITNYKISSITNPDGTVINYNADGLIASVVYPDESLVTYSYVKIGGSIVETILTDVEKTTHYNSENKLTSVEYITGKTITYDNGILSQITDVDGKVYVYEETQVTVGGQIQHVVTLKEIVDASGITYHIANNDITIIELTDGTLISNFQLDGSGNILDATIEYADGTILLVESGKLAEIEDVNGIITTYQYILDGSDDVLSCNVTIDDHGDITHYTYTANPQTGAITIEETDNENRTYEFNALGRLERFIDDAGILEHSYDVGDTYLGANLTLQDGTVEVYDANGNITEIIPPDGTIFEYYESGPFAGNLKKVVDSEGNSVFYTYGMTESQDLVVYKKFTYEDNSSYQYFYSENPLNNTQNPSLKATFNLDGAKSYPSIYANASYYASGDKRIGLSINFSNQKADLSYYYYNYQTPDNVSERETLGITINDDVDYTLEYVWTGTAVEVYVYESSGPRPGTPLYTLDNYEWDPKFSISGTDANIVLDPSSSGSYTDYKRIYTNASNPPGGHPSYLTEVTFDGTAQNKTLYHTIEGDTTETYDAIYFNYYNDSAHLRTYRYDYDTQERTYNTTPVNITFDADTTYINQTDVEEGALKLYVYEKGTAPGDPVYTMENVSWDPSFSSTIYGGEIAQEAYADAEVYEYDDATGNMLVCRRATENETVTYLYDGNGDLIFKELILADGTVKKYNTDNRLVREEKPNGEVTEYAYDADGNLISVTPAFPPGSVLIYYNSGDFTGNLEKVILPDGSSIYFEYRITDEQNLAVSKRFSYNYLNFYQSYGGTSRVDRANNPYLKASLNLDSSKAYPSVYAHAYYYEPGDRYVYLTFNLRGQTPKMTYYSYDYTTGAREIETQALDITINKDTDYTIEYLWEGSNVNVYIYEASQPRPGTPAYTLSDAEWDPLFTISGQNAGLAVDPSSSGEYNESKRFYTDYNNPLQGAPVHTAEFTFDGNAASKSFYYQVQGQTDILYEYINLSYYNGTAYFYHRSYDYQTHESVYGQIPLNVNLNDNTTYIVKTKVEDGTLSIYLYENGQAPGDPIYTLENISWDPSIVSSINGGEITAEAYDNLETYEYATGTVETLSDKDVDENMRNKNTILGDMNKTLPGYVYTPRAPLIFPDGVTDIVNGIAPNFGFSITLPGNMFGANGEIVPGYDFDGQNKPYFNVVKYDDDSLIKEIVKPDGAILTYPDGLPTCFLTGVSSTVLTGSPGDIDAYETINNYVNSLAVDAGSINRVSDSYCVGENAVGRVATYKKFGTTFLVNSYTEADGTFTVFNYENGTFTGSVKTLSNGEIEIYDADNVLRQRRIPDTSFLKGVNLAWMNYGYDLGLVPGSTYHIGYSTDLEALYTKLDSRKGDFVRLFLFCDLRSSIRFDASGTPLGFTGQVYEDMQALLDAAEAFNIKVMPTLFDYGIADGVSFEGEYEVGEHPGLFTDPAKKQALLDLFDGFFDQFAGHDSIYAWDIINEPEYATAVSMPSRQDFVRDFVDLIHSKAPDAVTTVGSRNRDDLVTYWTDCGLDLYQFHYYNNHEGFTPLNYPAANLGLDKPVLAGELEPTSFTYKLNTLKNNGYAGGFFWEDDWFVIDDEEYAEIKDWFSGTIIDY